MPRLHLAVPALAGLLTLAACQSGEDPELRRRSIHTSVASPMKPLAGSVYEAALARQLPQTPPEVHPNLHNVFQLSENILSGSEPHDEEAFQILQAKGIKTILSVDGKVPSSELAAKYGMRYVHVPIQYKGIAEDEMAQIAKTFREQEGPFYVHCFHGKHRGPAAAEVGRLVLDGVSREEALAEMRQWCGTAPSYEGLYAAIAYNPIPSATETKAMAWDFPAASPLDGIAGAMVEISRADDHLKALSKREWQPDPDHPDVDALNEATKLADLLERTQALQEVAGEPDDYRQWMRESVEQSATLRDALRALKAGTGTSEQAGESYKVLSRTCAACHDVYRN